VFRKKPEQTIIVEADKIASMKESLDALSWERVAQIGRMLQDGVSHKELDELSRELVAIAQANNSLLGKLGVSNESLSGVLMPSGIEMLVGKVQSQVQSHLPGHFLEAERGTASVPDVSREAFGHSTPAGLPNNPQDLHRYLSSLNMSAQAAPAPAQEQPSFFQQPAPDPNSFIPRGNTVPPVPTVPNLPAVRPAMGEGLGYRSGMVPAIGAAETGGSAFKAVFEPVITIEQRQLNAASAANPLQQGDAAAYAQAAYAQAAYAQAAGSMPAAGYVGGVPMPGPAGASAAGLASVPEVVPAPAPAAGTLSAPTPPKRRPDLTALSKTLFSGLASTSGQSGLEIKVDSGTNEVQVSVPAAQEQSCVFLNETDEKTRVIKQWAEQKEQKMMKEMLAAGIPVQPASENQDLKQVYASKDGSLFLYRDEDGHIIAVDSSKLA